MKWFNRWLLKKGKKFYCYNCCHRYRSNGKEYCTKNIETITENYYIRTVEYKLCENVNTNNNCLDYDKGSPYITN